MAILPLCILKVPNLTLSHPALLFTIDIRMNLAGRNFIVFLRPHNSYHNDTRIAGRFVLPSLSLMQLYLQEKSRMKAVRFKSVLEG
ncbi:unnamed protein product, partial [Tenebrio molitor]